VRRAGCQVGYTCAAACLSVIRNPRSLALQVLPRGWFSGLVGLLRRSGGIGLVGRVVGWSARVGLVGVGSGWSGRVELALRPPAQQDTMVGSVGLVGWVEFVGSGRVVSGGRRSGRMGSGRSLLEVLDSTYSSLRFVWRSGFRVAGLPV